MDQIDKEMTPLRTAIKNLQTQRGCGASEEAFNCEWFEKDCQESLKVDPSEIFKGDWTYVGRQYGKATVAGKPTKILFVSMNRSVISRQFRGTRTSRTRNINFAQPLCGGPPRSQRRLRAATDPQWPEPYSWI